MWSQGYLCALIFISLNELPNEKKWISLVPLPVTTAEIRPSRNLAEKTDKKWKYQILVSTCSWAAAQAGSTNCKFAVHVECDTFTILPWRILVVSLKELPNEKIQNLSFSVFLSGSVSRVYQLQDRISMRYLHYPNPENTRSIKKLRTNM